MLKKHKLLTLITASIVTTTLFTGCLKNDANKSSASKGSVKKIGITQIVEHPALDSARKGFIKALEDNGFKEGENLEIDYQNAQNDMPTTQTIANKFVSDKKDLILAISTPSAQAAYNATKDIPILMTAVTDPVSAGLVNSLEQPGGNVSGTSDYIPVEKNLELVKKFAPQAKNIGILYNTSEINSKIQVDKLKEYASKNGFNIIEKGVSSSNEINQAASSIMNDIDVLYIPTDNLIVSAMPIISKIATDNKIPVIASESGVVKSGALASQGIDYEKLGYKTGELAVKILNGEKVSDIPVATLDETELVVNEDILKALGLEKPDDKNITYVKTETN